MSDSAIGKFLSDVLLPAITKASGDKGTRKQLQRNPALSLFVIVPQVPEFSPVVWISRLSLLEYVEAIYPPYATSSIKAATIKFAVASPASPMSDEIACKFPTVVFGSLPNHD